MCCSIISIIQDGGSSKSALEIDHQTGSFHPDQSKLTLMMSNTYYSVSIGHGMLRAVFCYFIF